VSLNRTERTELPEHDSGIKRAVDKSARAETLGQDNWEKAQGQDSWYRTAGIEQLGQDNQDKTAVTGQPEQESEDRRTGTGKLERLTG
jgi:hypothetical protein